MSAHKISSAFFRTIAIIAVLLAISVIFTGSIDGRGNDNGAIRIETNLLVKNQNTDIRIITPIPLAGQQISLMLIPPASGDSNPSTKLSRDFFGVSGVQLLWLPPEQQQTEISLAAAAGAKYINLDFDWASIEPKKGEFNWRRTDRVFQLAKRYGIRLVPLLMYTPLWASSAAYAPLDYNRASPRDLNDYRDFVYAVVNRYKPQNDDAYGIRDWVIWNEPNVSTSPDDPLPLNFWTGSIEEYIQLLQLGYEAAHAADPGCNVLNGGLADVSWEPGKADLLTALQRLYDPNGDGDAADGARPYFDSLNLHIYQLDTPSADWYTSRLDQAILLMKRFGDSNKPIWITETGYGSTKTQDTDIYYINEEAQADAVRMVYDILSGYPQVGRIFWWSLRDYYNVASVRNQEMEAHYGLLHANYYPKPAYLEYAHLMNSLGNPIIFTTTTDSLGTAQITIPAKYIAKPGYYVFFASSDKLPETAVMVYTLHP